MEQLNFVNGQVKRLAQSNIFKATNGNDKLNVLFEIDFVSQDYNSKKDEMSLMLVEFDQQNELSQGKPFYEIFKFKKIF